MRIVIAGCGRVGRSVAEALASAGDNVSVIDDDPDAEALLGSTFDGAFHLGVAYDVDTLEEAGIRDADVFLAVTNSDNANLMAVQVATSVFGVPRAIARLDDPAREPAYRALDVDFVAGAQLVSNVMVERIHEPDFSYHVSFPTGEAQVVEMTMGPEADGLAVADLEIEGSLRVAAIQRDRRVIIPAQETKLTDGDIVVAAVRRGVLAKVRRWLAVNGGLE
jgi:trk system potassium uptake protein TrkA